MATIIFDADGVLYDSVKKMYDITNQSLQKFNIGPISYQEFRNAYYPTDWTQTFTKYGLKPNQFDQYLKEYQKNEKILKTSKLIPPKKLFHILKNNQNHTLHILTAANQQDIENRLKNDNIKQYFTKIISCNNKCKADNLIEIINSKQNKLTYFIGDSTADAQATIEARHQGTDLTFLGILHNSIGLNSKRELHVSSKTKFDKTIEKRKDKLIYNLSYLAKEL